MIKIKIQAQGQRKLTIRIPYGLLHLANGIICSNFVWKKIIKSNPSLQSLPFPLHQMNKHYAKPMIKQLIREMQNYRGLVIVDIDASDGSILYIRL
ncbi:hypothetical protein ACFFIS_05610 [Virgibacillus soli]|uniref:Uncharacterized protein n=1 Tax=Paracerasibacillus soli TaxID=480284 RepID=A0ABU5CTG6_9BACI|nr:hypothetical protein [Virgibacillus soli]MDY0409669.1 hypothetical protein [Virgibacillus soli]